MSLSFSDAAKARKLREYFSRHGRIYIVVDATCDDVQAPEELMGDPALRLVLNARMPQPILIHDDRLDSDFSFSGKIFPCRIPMHTIWAAYLPDGELEQGIIWDDSVPEMIKAIVNAVRRDLPLASHEQDAEQAKDEAKSAVAESPAPLQSPGMNIIDGGSAEKKPAPAGRRASHLRVVK